MLRKPHYGWMIVISCMLMTGASVNLYYNCNAVFVDYICKDLSITKGVYSISDSLFLIFSMPMYAVYAFLTKKFTSRPIMYICGIGCTISRVLIGLANGVVLLYIGSALYGFFVPGIKYMLTSMLIDKWFIKKRGMAFSLSLSGAAIIGAIMIQVFTKIVISYGWRISYFVMAGLGAVILIIAWMIVREDPKQKGTFPYGYSGEIGGPDLISAAPLVQKSGIPYKSAIKRYPFIIMFIAVFLIDCVAGGTYNFTVSYLTSVGYSAETSSIVLSCISIFGILARFIIGWAYDKYGLMVSNIVMGTISVVSMFSLFIAKWSKTFIWAYSMTFCVTYMAAAVIKPWFARDYLGDMDYPVLYSFLSLAGAAGGAVGNMFTGFMYDYLGTYVVTWFIYGVAAIVSTFMFIAATSRKSKEYLKKYVVSNV